MKMASSKRVYEDVENPMNLLKAGTKFSGVIEKSVPGGFLLTIRTGNSIGLQGEAMFITDQSDFLRNQQLLITGIDINKTPNYHYDYHYDYDYDEFLSYYSDFEMPPSPKNININEVEPLLQITHKIVPVMLNRNININNFVNQNTSSRRDPFLPINFPSPALSIFPPSDLPHKALTRHMQL